MDRRYWCSTTVVLLLLLLTFSTIASSVSIVSDGINTELVAEVGTNKCESVPGFVRVCLQTEDCQTKKLGTTANVTHACADKGFVCCEIEDTEGTGSRHHRSYRRPSLKSELNLRPAHGGISPEYDAPGLPYDGPSPGIGGLGPELGGVGPEYDTAAIHLEELPKGITSYDEKGAPYSDVNKAVNYGMKYLGQRDNLEKELLNKDLYVKPGTSEGLYSEYMNSDDKALQAERKSFVIFQAIKYLAYKAGDESKFYLPGKRNVKYTEGKKYEGDKYEGGKYEGGKYGEAKYEGDKYEGGKYKGGKYGEAKYEGDKYEGAKYEGDKYEGAKYEGDKYDEGVKYGEGVKYDGGVKYDSGVEYDSAVEYNGGDKYEGMEGKGPYVSGTYSKALYDSVSSGGYSEEFPKTDNKDYNINKGCKATKYRTIDGHCNNLKNPEWGRALRVYNRLLPASYGDGTSSPRLAKDNSYLPNARLVSTKIVTDESHPVYSNSLMVMQWGQFVDHDMSFSSVYKARGSSGILCCAREIQYNKKLLHPECYPIIIPSNDYFYSRHGSRCMEFVRSLVGTSDEHGYNTGKRQQLNQVSSYIDGSIIYGTTLEEANSLRTFKQGTLVIVKERGFDYLPVQKNPHCTDPSLCFRVVAGDARANMHPWLTVIHILFVREHNRLAYGLYELNPDWDDEYLYQEARRIVGAIFQHITYTELLPSFLGYDVLEKYGLTSKKYGYSNDYNDYLNPTTLNEFSAAAFRVGHSLINGVIEYRSREYGNGNLGPLRNHFFDPLELFDEGEMDKYILSLMTQLQEGADVHVTREVTNYLFKTNRTTHGLDLISLNIQRGRDHGIPSYNEYRKLCGYKKAYSFEELYPSVDRDVIDKLKYLYKTVDDVDLFIGGIAEKHNRNSLIGPTFACIIANQFRRIKKADRHWYEVGGQPSSFTPEQLKEIRKITLARIICSNSDKIKYVQKLVFKAPSYGNPPVECTYNNIAGIDLTKWKSTYQKGYGEESYSKPKASYDSSYGPVTDEYGYGSSYGGSSYAKGYGKGGYKGSAAAYESGSGYESGHKAAGVSESGYDKSGSAYGVGEHIAGGGPDIIDTESVAIPSAAGAASYDTAYSEADIGGTSIHGKLIETEVDVETTGHVGTGEGSVHLIGSEVLAATTGHGESVAGYEGPSVSGAAYDSAYVEDVSHGGDIEGHGQASYVSGAAYDTAAYGTSDVYGHEGQSPSTAHGETKGYGHEGHAEGYGHVAGGHTTGSAAAYDSAYSETKTYEHDGYVGSAKSEASGHSQSAVAHGHGYAHGHAGSEAGGGGGSELVHSMGTHDASVYDTGFDTGEAHVKHVADVGVESDTTAFVGEAHGHGAIGSYDAGGGHSADFDLSYHGVAEKEHVAGAGFGHGGVAEYDAAAAVAKASYDSVSSASAATDHDSAYESAAEAHDKISAAYDTKTDSSAASAAATEYDEAAAYDKVAVYGERSYGAKKKYYESKYGAKKGYEDSVYESDTYSKFAAKSDHSEADAEADKKSAAYDTSATAAKYKADDYDKKTESAYSAKEHDDKYKASSSKAVAAAAVAAKAKKVSSKSVYPKPSYDTYEGPPSHGDSYDTYEGPPSYGDSYDRYPRSEDGANETEVTISKDEDENDTEATGTRHIEDDADRPVRSYGYEEPSYSSSAAAAYVSKAAYDSAADKSGSDYAKAKSSYADSDTRFYDREDDRYDSAKDAYSAAAHAKKQSESDHYDKDLAYRDKKYEASKKYYEAQYGQKKGYEDSAFSSDKYGKYHSGGDHKDYAAAADKKASSYDTSAHAAKSKADEYDKKTDSAYSAKEHDDKYKASKASSYKKTAAVAKESKPAHEVASYEGPGYSGYDRYPRSHDDDDDFDHGGQDNETAIEQHERISDSSNDDDDDTDAEAESINIDAADDLATKNESDWEDVGDRSARSYGYEEPSYATATSAFASKSAYDSASELSADSDKSKSKSSYADSDTRFYDKEDDRYDAKKDAYAAAAYGKKHSEADHYDKDLAYRDKKYGAQKKYYEANYGEKKGYEDSAYSSDKYGKAHSGGDHKDYEAAADKKASSYESSASAAKSKADDYDKKTDSAYSLKVHDADYYEARKDESDRKAASQMQKVSKPVYTKPSSYGGYSRYPRSNENSTTSETDDDDNDDEEADSEDSEEIRRLVIIDDDHLVPANGSDSDRATRSSYGYEKPSYTASAYASSKAAYDSATDRSSSSDDRAEASHADTDRHAYDSQGARYDSKKDAYSAAAYAKKHAEGASYDKDVAYADKKYGANKKFYEARYGANKGYEDSAYSVDKYSKLHGASGRKEYDAAADKKSVSYDSRAYASTSKADDYAKKTDAAYSAREHDHAYKADKTYRAKEKAAVRKETQPAYEAPTAVKYGNRQWPQPHHVGYAARPLNRHVN